MDMHHPQREQLKTNLRDMLSAEVKGLQLDTQFRWVVSGVKDPVPFFQNLPLLLPPNGVVYFEGCSIAPDVAAIYERSAASDPVAVAPDTLSPVPQCFHVAHSPQFVSRLCELAAQRPVNELLDHVKGYEGQALVFHFHDAFDNDLLVSERVAEANILELCSRLNAKYSREPNINRAQEGLRALLDAMENPGKLRIAGEPWWRRWWRRFTWK